MEEEFETFGSKCSACGTPLEMPWICCAQCRPYQYICARCFSFGVEFGQHESDHPYMVMRYNFPIYEASWTAAEEIRLLEGIHEYGLGNWSAVSGHMRVKSAEDCERHYFKCFVDNPQPPLPAFDDPDNFDNGAPVVFKLSDNPPRPPEGSTLSVEMAGYSAARGDFGVEHDNFFELDLSHMTFADKESDEEEDAEPGNEILYRELKLAVLDVYRHCLIERQRRKKIVREYGLINVRKWYGMLKRRYEHSLSLELMRPFMRLFPPITFDKYMESLHYEKQLKSEIFRLQEFRRNGITRLRLVKAYCQMKQRRDHIKSQRHLFTDVLSHVKDEQSYLSWLAKQALLEGSSKKSLACIPVHPARKMVRLRIDGLPGYEKLNDAEKDMCSEVRLVPQAYLEFSRILASECARQGFLRLAQARALIKIDVNKTRKLYDFLISEGLINKNPL